MHRGLSSVMMNYARSISDEKKAKTIVKGNKSGKITGSRDDIHEKLLYKCGLKPKSVWDPNSKSWYTKVYYADGRVIIQFCFTRVKSVRIRFLKINLFF
jgi:hypothetical protein